MDDSYITIATCNYNTSQLTNNLIQSVFENFSCMPFKFIVLDNSDKEKFTTTFNVKTIDNTKGQYIDFNRIIDSLPTKVNSINNYASLKHAASIQFLLNICITSKMLLFDSDTVLLHDIDFIDPNIISAFDLEGISRHLIRSVPYVQYFNVAMLSKHNIKYFDMSRMHYGASLNTQSQIYDTGASFLEDCKAQNMNVKLIDHKKYIWHKKKGSW